MQAESTINQRHPAKTLATTRTAWQRASSGRAVVIAATALIQAVLTLGFVAMSLGLGAEDHVGVGPDRPPPPARMP
jgi:hypothetical protein